MKNKMAQATSSYYQNLITQYTSLFGAFVVLATVLFVGFLLFGYSGIKDAMWKTNLTLKIMPLDYIPKHCLPELKAFYKY
jgi:hypothetical protein